MQRRRLLKAVLLCALASRRTTALAASSIQIIPGSGSFDFSDLQGDASKRMTVYTYLPPGVDAATARIVFVMHGHGKNAEGYRDVWIEHADRYRCMVVTPLFDKAQWGGAEYAYSSVEGRDGDVHDVSLWSFSVIEHLFDAVKSATGNRSERYFIYGHSEGGQFVHRLALLLPGARYERAVAANPGWYTMPQFDVRFPFGLQGAPVTRASLAQSLQRRLVVMLGDQDIDPNHPQLNKSRRAEAQGATRFERGQTFFRAAQAASAALGVPLAWQLRVVPGAAHQNSKMAQPAAEVLMGS